ncbi:MAG: class I SAM-dependent methyltransferase [Actinomycetota bacterium]|nr:class I SAM-dependent methyltransferase [Actinomycetota bacterium]
MALGDEVRARPGWLLEETAFAGRENLDAGHVARYDQKMDAEAEEEVALLKSLGLNSGSTVVDLGAGTGQFAISVAGSCQRVVAVDVSPVMLRALEANAAAAGVDNIEIVQAGFLTYDHVGAPADFVYSRFALHHLPDFWKAVALARIRHMLRPTGAVRLWDAVYGFAPDEAEERVEAWCATGGTEATSAWTRAEFEEHVRDENSTFTWLLEPMMRRSGFEILQATYSEDGIFARYVLQRT